MWALVTFLTTQLMTADAVENYTTTPQSIDDR